MERTVGFEMPKQYRHMRMPSDHGIQVIQTLPTGPDFPFQSFLHGFSAAQQLPSSEGSIPAWPFPQRPKPPCSIRELIALSLHNLPENIGSCQQICDFVRNHFPYYRGNTQWHHTVKCRITEKKYFIKQDKRCNYKEYKVSPEFLAELDMTELQTRLRNHKV